MKRIFISILFIMLTSTLFLFSCTQPSGFRSSKSVTTPDYIKSQRTLEKHEADVPILVIDTGGHMALIRDVMFNSDGRYLVSASEDKTVRIWNVSTGEVARVLRGQIGAGPEGKIFAASISPDDRILAVGGWMGPAKNYKLIDVGIIRLIDINTGEVKALLKGHSNVILGLAFSPDGTKLISGSGDYTARIWDVSTGKTIHELKGHTKSIYAVAFSPDGKRTVTGSDDQTLKLWDAKSASLIRTMIGHNDLVKSVAFTSDGRYLLSSSWDKTIRLWNGRTGDFIGVLARQDAEVSHLSISPDGTKVVTGYGEGIYTNNVFSIPSGEQITSFTKHENVVLATAISPDGKTAATGGGEHEIYLWDIDTGQVKDKMVGKGKVIPSVGFAKDGRSIAWGKMWKQNSVFVRGPLEQSFQIKGTGKTFDLSMGRVLTEDTGYLRALESVGPWSIRTKDGIVNPTLQILKNGIVQHEIIRGPIDGIDHRSLTLTPDGQTVISGGGWGILTSYNPSTGKKIHDFVGHTGDVWAVACSPDSKFLVSGSHDQTVRLWEIDTGKLLLTIFQGTDSEWVAWIPAGYYTASLSGDNYIGWHINRGEDKSALYYSASSFAKQFYSPKVVANYLKTNGNLDKAIRLANRVLPENDKVEKIKGTDVMDIAPPTVFFNKPGPGGDAETDKQFFCVEAGAESLNQEPVTDIWITLNGRRPEITTGTEPHTRIRGKKAFIKQCLKLTQKENRISVIAKNAKSQSDPRTIRLTFKSKSVDIDELYKPTLYLLAIGISDYERSDYNLDFAHKDAEDIDSAFQDQHGKGKLYREVNTRLLTNEKATRDAILEGLEWIKRESTQHDVSVIFISGHGENDENNNYYFLPYEADRDHLISTGVLWFYFQNVLKSMPSKTFFWVDTCHSGGVTGERRKGGADITEALRELIQADSGIFVMTASTRNEVSIENKEWGHGAFTHALVEGLREFHADYNKNKQVEIKELDLYVTHRVKELTGGRQHPTTQIPKTLTNFPIAVK